MAKRKYMRVNLETFELSDFEIGLENIVEKLNSLKEKYPEPDYINLRFEVNYSYDYDRDHQVLEFMGERLETEAEAEKREAKAKKARETAKKNREVAKAEAEAHDRALLESLINKYGLPDTKKGKR
jgi:hypothetical protein